MPIAEWPEVKVNYRYYRLPELEADGAVLHQSNVISPDARKLSGLYPEGYWPAVTCDAVKELIDPILAASVS